jgi:hypothetical protein
MKEFRSVLASSTPSRSDEELSKIEAKERAIYLRSGYRGSWRERLRLHLERQTDLFSYYALLKYNNLLGEKEQALEALEKSYENRDFMLPFVNTDPLYDGLRADPRFQSVMRRMNLSR